MQVLFNFALFIFGIMMLKIGIKGFIKKNITLVPYAGIGSSRKVTATGVKAFIWSLAVIIGGFAFVLPFIGNIVTFLKLSQ